MIWLKHLKPDEVERIAALRNERRMLNAEYRRIYNRARKRAERKPHA